MRVANIVPCVGEWSEKVLQFCNCAVESYKEEPFCIRNYVRERASERANETDRQTDRMPKRLRFLSPFSHCHDTTDASLLAGREAVQAEFEAAEIVEMVLPALRRCVCV